MVASAPASSPSVVTVVDPDDTDQGPMQPNDGYPDFSTPLTAANTQMSNDQAAALEAKLSALGAQRRAGTVSDAEYRQRLLELRGIAEKHGSDATTRLGN